MTTSPTLTVGPGYGRRALAGALAYGLGLLAGGVVTGILFNTITLSLFNFASQAAALITGIILAIVITGIGAALGGFIGGAALDGVGKPRGRWGYGWRSALSLALPYGLLLFPLMLTISLVSFYNIGSIEASKFAGLFAILGALVGLVNGLILGALTVWRRGTGRVTLASFLGFAVGGVGLGYGLWRWLNSLSLATPEPQIVQDFWLLLGVLLFGLAGGAALGIAYHYLAVVRDAGKELPAPPKTRFWRILIALALVVLLIVVIRPVVGALTEFLTPASAEIQGQLQSNAVGTHWLAAAPVVAGGSAAKPRQPELAAGGGQVAAAWLEGAGAATDLLLSRGQFDEGDLTTTWGQPVVVTSAAGLADPALAIDSQAAVHIVWSAPSDTGPVTFYSQCQAGACQPPVNLSLSSPACALPTGATALESTAPALAIDDEDQLLAVWQNGGANLAYSHWPAGEAPPTEASGCVLPEAAGSVLRQPRLDGGGGRFSLVFNQGEAPGEIRLIQFFQEQWDPTSRRLGDGAPADVFMAADGQAHAIWCAQDEGISHWTTGGSETLDTLPCSGRPALGQDSEGALHAVWYGDEVRNSLGHVTTGSLLYESILGEEGWSEPAIVAWPVVAAQPAVASDESGLLHLAWSDESDGETSIQHAAQLHYRCDETELSGAAAAVFDIARLEIYRRSSDIVPFCHNQYDRLVFTPNPAPAYSDDTPTTNGAFDVVADLVTEAEYEVLFSTMWYDQDKNDDSPGSVLADAVAELYQKLAANPAEYPRGLTVRILLGNPPEFAAGKTGGQIWNVLEDLRDAGVPEMQNPDIGWDLQVANFAGAWPHSHTKMVVVDGKSVIGAGFNYSYAHFDADHYSGNGEGRNDLGIQATGPVAQDSQRVFDDLWQGANRRHCRDFGPVYWQFTCNDSQATVEHVPEVRRYYVTGGDASAFSMYRSQERQEADRQITDAIASASKSVDAVHVMFTMQMACDLNLLYDVCGFDGGLPTLASLKKAAQNGAHLRLLVKPDPFDGVESSVAVEQFIREMESAGLGDAYEIRLFQGPMHFKSTLIDDEFLIVGSQNFHYSAFGDGGLTEYSLGIEDPEAVADFKKLFEFHWQRAKKLEPGSRS